MLTFDPIIRMRASTIRQKYGMGGYLIWVVWNLTRPGAASTVVRKEDGTQYSFILSVEFHRLQSDYSISNGHTHLTLPSVNFVHAID